MFEKSQNLCESVIDGYLPKQEWIDEVYLADRCKERFLTQTEIPEWQSAEIFMAGIAELRDGYYVERYGVGVHTLLFTLKGGGVLITKDRVWEIAPYSLTILPAHTPFRFEMNPQLGHWDMIWLLPKPTEKWQHIERMGQTVVSFHETELIWSLMCLLYGEIGGRPSYRRMLVSEAARMLLVIEPTISTSLSRVQTLFNEVESQLHLPWSVADMASRCFISEEQFNRLTKQLFGVSPRTRLIQLRMEKAADLLRYKEWTITMISHRLGYKDPYNFTHRFKKYFGISPTHFRKNHQ
ncbi:TPA: helix-turn-helix transcriptional regulator [Vibrio vulnificus]|uniref:helix-turn-helix transcriptional regulator n=1 Tax=Vibrio vulnificus TaxID=672 RepID=UPI0001F5B284|nr:AraC family transcriptional regulator [Vibrio vulnificus]ADV88852.1 transcriptional regulator AraC family [Vibrio vulnificus MO6-24/O]EGR0095813.1 AraC family transcriptional regulator [Vibrio vulnificus]EGR7940839.1 helix-turn-helix transcriptional regulator [Vibrio vulnificus]EHH0748582.1 helix-turn-helix transcriptional regulator [Vibrio vulnificus]EHT4939630.1 helix-turn-helix transcriptional regulator [Vibrio vulnificus]